MSLRLASLALAAVVTTANIETAHAGFWTDVAKGTVKNAARHTAQSTRRVAEKVANKGAVILLDAGSALQRLRNR